MSKTFTHLLPIACIVGSEGGDFELLAEVEFNLSPFVPAKLSGPPEDCYEAYGGDVEVIGVRLLAEEPKLGMGRTYFDAPLWLLAMIEAAIDTDELAMSVLPDEGEDPDDWSEFARERRDQRDSLIAGGDLDD